MKRIITLLSFLLYSILSFAQNIVPNYSFELADSCPVNLNDRTYEYSLGCTGWGQGTNGNPDYYNACDTAAASIGRQNPIVGVPFNILGYQTAYEGVAYVGINTYALTLNDYKEYLITSIPALEIDTAYEVTIHISLADVCKYATGGMGVLFTTYGSPGQFIDTTITKTPQIDYSSYGVISDISNWTTLTEVFIADSAYTSLIIGVFKSSSQMQIVAVNDSTSVPPYNAYYYIDNVVVEKLSSTGFASFINNNKIYLFPNPLIDHATLIYNNEYHQNNTLSIYNAQGQEVNHIDNITSDRVRIDRNGLLPGFYYYKLSNNKNIIANGKIIIN